MASLHCRSCGAAVARNASFCSECGVRSPGAQNPLSTFEAPLERPRATPFSRRRGNQGVIAGVLGSCFGFLGIFTLGLIFVPLAIVCSLFGLARGLAGQSTAGTGMSIVGLTLSAIGFFSSPSLMLLAGGLLVASQTDSGSSTDARRADPSEVGQELPLQERKFCEITSAASEKYEVLASQAKKARDDKNGILEKRAEEAMTSTARNRNAEILKLAQETGFKFEQWGVQLLKVGSPNDKRITFSVRPLCSDIVTIHLTASPTGPLLEALAAKRKGDSFFISGTFVGSRADNDTPPTAPDAKRFEISITERGSMQEPEYWALLRY